MSKKQNYLQRIIAFFKARALKIKNYFFSRKFLIFLGVLFFALLICYAVLVFFAKDLQIKLTFPGTDINIKEITNHPAGLIVAEDVSFTSDAGETITGIYIDNNSEKVVYYFHGNGAPLEYFYSDVQYISDLGYSVIALEYPGYGDSSGKPSFETNSRVANEFYDKMQNTLGFQEKDTILWGYSVGTALAVEFGAQRDFDSLVLFAPFASRYDMAPNVFGIPLAKYFFLENSYISKDRIQDITEPTLIIHGNNDKVVPFEQGKLVYENSPAEKKFFIEIDNFGHSLIPERYGNALQGYIKNFLMQKSLEQEQYFLDRDLATDLLEKFQIEQKIERLDFETDSSITKYVDPQVSFQDKKYVPENLVAIENDFIADSKGNGKIREIAAEKLQEMAEAFYKENGEKMLVVSSYRSYAYQAGIKARGCPDHLCSKAGHSEHQSGLAVDFWSASTKDYWDNSQRLTEFYTWLRNNAHKYGFHNSYQNGREVDGYAIEPWHWRYLGEDFAQYLNEKDMTFAEYYSLQNKNE